MCVLKHVRKFTEKKCRTAFRRSRIIALDFGDQTYIVISCPLFHPQPPILNVRRGRRILIGNKKNKTIPEIRVFCATYPIENVRFSRKKKPIRKHRRKREEIKKST